MSQLRRAVIASRWAKGGPLQLSLLKALPPPSRAEREARIEALIRGLDDEDGDADLEATGDGEPDVDLEPAMGWSTMGAQGATPAELAGGPDFED